MEKREMIRRLKEQPRRSNIWILGVPEGKNRENEEGRNHQWTVTKNISQNERSWVSRLKGKCPAKCMKRNIASFHCEML